MIGLDFLANILFDISCKDKSKEDDVKEHIQAPGNREAQHNIVKRLFQRIDEFHPQDAESQGEENVGDTGKHRIAKGLKGMRNYAVDRGNEGKKRDVEHSAHTVPYGFCCIEPYDQTEEEFSEKEGDETHGAGKRDGEEHKAPKALDDALFVFCAEILSDKGGGCNGKSA